MFQQENDSSSSGEKKDVADVAIKDKKADAVLERAEITDERTNDENGQKKGEITDNTSDPKNGEEKNAALRTRCEIWMTMSKPQKQIYREMT